MDVLSLPAWLGTQQPLTIAHCERCGSFNLYAVPPSCNCCCAGGVALRPSFIYGSRAVGGASVPLGLVGAPLKAVSKCGWEQ